MPIKSERQRIYRELCDFVLSLSSADREGALASLRARFGAEQIVRPTHRPLSANELRELAGSGLIEIGAHTRSHQMLAARTPSEQREEVLGSKVALEAATGRAVRLFSYPYGGQGMISDRSATVVRDAGFRGAFTTRFGVTSPWTNRFELPRCPTENIGAAEFAKRLDRWFEMGR